MAPILKLVLFWAQSQHGLCVGMELIVKVVQEGSPCPVLERKEGGGCGAGAESRDVPSPWALQTPG